MIFILSLACSSGRGQDSPWNSTEKHPCFADEAELILGEGETAFSDFNENLESVMVHGPQGGWHILGSFYLFNSLQILDVEFNIEHLTSGVLISENNYRVAMILDGECQGYYPGLYGYINVENLVDGSLDTPPELLSYEPVRMTMRINDCGVAQETEGLCQRSDRWIEESIDLVAMPDPMDVE